jgi:hypothetical protein
MKHLFAYIFPILLTGCLLETVGPIDRSIKPYGAHWAKEGMTRESRRADLAACGSINHEHIGFPEELLKRTKLPDEPNEINAYLRLRDQLGVCMTNRGYQAIGDLKYLGGCDERCMYP